MRPQQILTHALELGFQRLVVADPTHSKKPLMVCALLNDVGRVRGSHRQHTRRPLCLLHQPHVWHLGRGVMMIGPITNSHTRLT